MKIVNLKLHNFRNYESLFLEFSNKQNIIIGPNGSGKTNIVEAIYTLAITKSFRGTLDKILINFHKNDMKIEGKVKDKIFHNYSLELTDAGKIVRIDNNNKNFSNKTHEKPDPDMGNEGDYRLGPAALLSSRGLGPTDHSEGYREG